MAIATANKTDRIQALDFTKGTLVLFMVLYHWLNYFISPQGDFYRYLRFLTPSFIFITGFLISHVYLFKYQVGDRRAPKRLVLRSVKILALFILLNVAASVLVSRSYNGQILFDHSSVRNIVAIYITGQVGVAEQGKLAAFYILVPISYLLLLSAGLLIAYRLCKYILHFVCVLSLVCIVIVDVNRFESPNLELLTIGLLGVISGYIALEKINRFVRRPYAVVAAYVCYTSAITFWPVIYPLQVVGVYLTLMLIYLVGDRNCRRYRMRSHVVLIGRYSLLGYILQIAVLQLLYRGLGHINLGAGTLLISFFGAFALTMISIEVVDRARGRSTTVDWLYKAVFA